MRLAIPTLAQHHFILNIAPRDPPFGVNHCKDWTQIFEEVRRQKRLEIGQSEDNDILRGTLGAASKYSIDPRDATRAVSCTGAQVQIFSERGLDENYVAVAPYGKVAFEIRHWFSERAGQRSFDPGTEQIAGAGHAQKISRRLSIK